MVTSDCHLPPPDRHSKVPSGKRHWGWGGSPATLKSEQLLPHCWWEKASTQISLQYFYLNNLRETVLCIRKERETEKSELSYKTKIHQHAARGHQIALTLKSSHSSVSERWKYTPRGASQLPGFPDGVVVQRQWPILKEEQHFSWACWFSEDTLRVS